MTMGKFLGRTSHQTDQLSLNRDGQSEVEAAVPFCGKHESCSTLLTFKQLLTQNWNAVHWLVDNCSQYEIDVFGGNLFGEKKKGLEHQLTTQALPPPPHRGV